MMQQTKGSAHAARTHGRNPAKIEKSLERSPASIKRWSPRLQCCAEPGCHLLRGNMVDDGPVSGGAGAVVHS